MYLTYTHHVSRHLERPPLLPSLVVEWNLNDGPSATDGLRELISNRLEGISLILTISCVNGYPRYMHLPSRASMLWVCFPGRFDASVGACGEN